MLVLAGCSSKPSASSTVGPSPPTAPAVSPTSPPVTDSAPTSTAAILVTGMLPVFEAALAPGWSDYGWSKRTVGPGPAVVDMGDFGGWAIGWPNGADDLTTRASLVGLQFSYSAAADVVRELLVVQLGDAAATAFPEIRVTITEPGADGLRVQRVMFDQLNPLRHPFDRIIIKAGRKVPVGNNVTVDHIRLLTTSSS